MKKVFLFAFSLLLSLSSYAQLNAVHNSLRAGGNVEIIFFDGNL